MKRFYIVLCVLLGIVGVCVFSAMRIADTRESVTAHVDTILYALDKEDQDEMLTGIEDFCSYWKEQEHKLVRVVRHAQVDEITRSVSRLPALAAYEDYSQLTAELTSILWSIEHIWESELPSFNTIM